MSNIPEERIDKRADLYPCYLCLCGMSVEEIAERLNTSKQEVKVILLRSLDFEGWENNLGYNLWQNKDYLSEREDYSLLYKLLKNYERMLYEE